MANLRTIINRALPSNKDVSVFSSLTTGLFAGIMMVIITVTYASLIFSGALSQFLIQGIFLALSSVIIIGLFHTLFSSSSHIVTQIDDDTAPVFALLLSLLVGGLPATMANEALLVNVLAAIFVASLIAGSVLALFGTFRFGNFVQFLPYSVMGGYFAAVGWLLLLGALTMLTSIEFESLDDLNQLFQSDTLARWLPALVVGIWLKIMSNRINIGLLLAGTFLVMTCAFYAYYSFTDTDVSTLMSNNHLIGPFPEQQASLINPVSDLAWQLVDWDAIIDNAGSIASITLICLLSIILGISGLSLSTRQDLNTNSELKVSGIANMTSAALGGMSALPSLTISKLAYDIHPKQSRLLGLTAITVGVLTMYFGMDIVAHIPKVVLGALLIYIGLGFVIEWLFEGYRRFGALEYSVIPIILIVSIFAGFLQSIVTGIIAAIILFVIKYSRVKIIRYQASGAELRSNIVRDIEQNKVLQQYGGQVQLFTLQGYLFFGTAGSLYKTVLHCVNDDQHRDLKYVILDFSQVIGVDSSATLNFEKLAQRLSERRIYLITTNLQQDVLDILQRGGLDLENNQYLIQHADLDQGVEWCENSILQNLEAKALLRRGIIERITDAIPDYEHIDQLTGYLTKIDVEAGQKLVDIGEESDEVFFLETCTASAYILDSSGKERRVAGAGRGAIFGEIGFFLGIPRTAIVKADTSGEIFSLSTESLKKMEQEHPEIAAAITRYLAKVVTERLVSTTQSLQAVL